MNPLPITDPLPGEHLLATTPALAPDASAGWRQRLNFWSGRALTAEALEGEQAHRSGRLAALGTQRTPGIAAGLGVGLAAPTPAFAPATPAAAALANVRVRIEPGLGLTAGGNQIVVPRALEVGLGDLPWQFAGDDPRAPRSDGSGGALNFGFPWAAVLLLAPTEGIQIDRRAGDDPSELDPEADAFADPRRVEYTTLRLWFLPANFLPPVLPDGAVAPDSAWRNRTVYALFTAEAARRRAVDEIGLHLNREAAPWEAVGVALALVSVEADLRNPGQCRVFLDRASVARRAGWPRLRPRPASVARAGGPSLWEARIRQFAEHWREAFGQLVPDPAQVRQTFRFLPPAGVLPRSALTLLDTDRARRFQPPRPGRPSDRAGSSQFFPADWHLDAIPVPQDELEATLATSASLAAFDLAATTADRVRLLVPVARQDYERDLLVVAEPDARVQAELQRLVEVRRDWLGRRTQVRSRQGDLLRTATGRRPTYPAPKDDPARTDAEELLTPDLPAHPGPIYASPRTLPEVARFAFGLAPGAAQTDTVSADVGAWFNFQVDREFPPEAIRVVLENTADGRRVAVLWSAPGIPARWGTAVEREFRLGPVPAPGAWPQAATSLAESGFAPMPFHRVTYEVLRGRLALVVGLPLSPATALPMTAYQPQETDWTLVAGFEPGMSPLEERYEPTYEDGSSLDERLETIETALRRGIARRQAVPAANGAPAIPAEPRQLDDLGLATALDRLAAEADQADDFVDLYFTRAQTNLYRVRKFILGQNAAQKLLVNPALAAIAEQETSVANADQLSAFITAARSRKTPRAEVDAALGRPIPPAAGGGNPAPPGNPAPGGGAVAFGGAGAALALPKTNLHQLGMGGLSSVAKFKLTPTGGFDVGVTEVAAAGLRETLKQFDRGVAKEFSPGKEVITAQLPDSGPALPPRGLTIGKRFEEPKATENLRYIRTALRQLLEQLPLLRLRLVGEKMRAGDGQTEIPLVRLQGFKEDGSELTGEERLQEINKMLNFPDTAGEIDEADVTVTALDMMELKTALLRLIERATQARRELLTRGRETLAGVEARVQEASGRLTLLEARVAEARHDVSVARALWTEEQTRVAEINARRDAAVLRAGFIGFVRPRTLIGARSDTATAPLDRADAPRPVPECLRRHDEPPEELSEYVALLRHAPARWFTDLAPRLRELDTPAKIVRLIESAKSNAARYGASVAPSAKMLRSHPGVQAVYERRTRTLESRRLITAQIPLDDVNARSWAGHQELASEHASLGDVIEARHGHATLAAAASQLMEQLRDIGTCLHAEFAAVTPALRLAWTERLSQFDADTDLRELSVLPRWGELSKTSRRRFQEFVHWLFERVNASEPEALALIDDLIRLVLLLASHAPVNQLIEGHVPRPTPIALGGLVVVKAFDPDLIRAGMEVVVWDQARLVARARVEDLRGIDTAIRMHQISEKVTTLDTRMRVQFVRAANFKNVRS